MRKMGSEKNADAEALAIATAAYIVCVNQLFCLYYGVFAIKVRGTPSYGPFRRTRLDLLTIRLTFTRPDVGLPVPLQHEWVH
jgi:hypothetical protein